MHSSLAGLVTNGQRCSLGIDQNRVFSVDFDDLGVIPVQFNPIQLFPHLPKRATPCASVYVNPSARVEGRASTHLRKEVHN